MSITFSNDRWEIIFGRTLAQPQKHKGSVHLHFRVDEFEALLQRWRELDSADLPRLQGLSVARPATSGECRRLLILEIDPGRPLVLLSVEWSGSAPFSSLRSIWPHCSWWELEMQRFDGAAIRGAGDEGSVSWRHV